MHVLGKIDLTILHAGRRPVHVFQLNRILMHVTSLTPSGPLFERTLGQLSEGIACLNRQHRVVYINGAGQQIIENGCSRSLRQGDLFLELAREERRTFVETMLESAWHRQQGSYEIEYPQQGEPNWFELSYLPLQDGKGNVDAVCIKAVNITEKKKLIQHLEIAEQQRRDELITAVQLAQEKERTQIGRELHDGVNQVLTTVKLYNELCLTEEQTNHKMLLKSIQQINYCIETLRTISHRLAAPELGKTSLKDAFTKLAASVNETRKTEVLFYCYGLMEERISPELGEAVLRIAQEQLTNILKYAQSPTVDLLLVGTSTSLALKIQDYGVGFDTKKKETGAGISNMRSRAMLWKGELEIVSSPGQGCTLTVEIPLCATGE
jgi:signal transduction histidine kinase